MSFSSFLLLSHLSCSLAFFPPSFSLSLKMGNNWHAELLWELWVPVWLLTDVPIIDSYLDLLKTKEFWYIKLTAGKKKIFCSAQLYYKLVPIRLYKTSLKNWRPNDRNWRMKSVGIKEHHYPLCKCRLPTNKLSNNYQVLGNPQIIDSRRNWICQRHILRDDGFLLFFFLSVTPARWSLFAPFFLIITML